MKLRYLTPLVYPSRYANRLQVIKMSEAFSRQSESFLLYVRELRQDIKKIFKEYEIGRTFEIRELGSPRFWPKSFFLALRARFLLEREKDAVWFLRDGLLAFWLSHLVDLKSGNFFFEVHAFERLPRFIYRRVFKAAAGIIATNAKKTEDIEKYFNVPLEKILTAPNGVDLRSFANLMPPRTARTGLGLPLEKILIVYVGTPSEEKGIKTILAASGLLDKDIQFVVVGGSKREIAAFKSDKNFGRIIWTGMVRHDQVPRYMAAADILAAPFSGKSSWTLFYTSPLKIPEYLASGKPIAVSDLPSLKDFVSEREVFFFKADDPGSFAETIKNALNKPEVMLEKGGAARERAKEFSWDKRAERIVKFMKTKIK